MQNWGFLNYLAVVWATILLSACALPPGTISRDVPSDLHGTGLATAELLLKRGKKIVTDDEVAGVYYLRAAELAWAELDTNGGSITDLEKLTGNQRQALEILNVATERVATQLMGEKYQKQKEFNHAGLSYRVNTGGEQKPGSYSLASFDSAIPATRVKHQLCTRWHTENGVGLPIAAQWKRPTDLKLQRFVSSRGYLVPVTAILRFERSKQAGKTRELSISSYDPTVVPRVKLGATEYPVAADFTAPIVQQTYDINEVAIALSGLIYPGVVDSKLILLEPYDPQRIPVLLVHGLNSHPRMWRDMINDLRADPKLRGRYQYMLFYYPTGWPIGYSALRLREELAALEGAVGMNEKMVLIGHSMGGIVSRMQAINPQQKIWKARLRENARELYVKLSSNHLLKRTLLFSANPNISREIYICTPHRGSGLADLSITGWFIKLLKLPTAITSAFIDLPANIIKRNQLTSVAGLSPSNPLFTALEVVPIEVPHHSIMGDRGKNDTPKSSDGVVPYWSSHLGSAESEVIVPDGHGAFRNPLAVREVRRILLLNARIKD